MSRRSSSHRRDDNHKAIVTALRAAGWHVQDTSQAGQGCPDLFAAKGGRLVPIEVKDGAKAPSAQALSPKEIAVHDAFAAAGVTVKVIRNVDEAISL